MPYFITDQSAECSAWATVKEDGEVMGCHGDKQGAIDQMVALSIEEDIEPGGERVLPDNYDPTDPAPVRRSFEREAARIQERTTMHDIEIRSLESEELELRAADTESGIGTFAGYAIRYDSPSLPLPFTERVAPGALTRTLKAKNDIRMYVNHDDRMVLASTRSKTLRLEDRADGLYVEADLPDTSYSRDLRELLELRVVSTMSFGFSTVKDSWSSDGSERTLDEIRLHEVSVVTGVAAYPATSASVRSWLIPAKRAAVDPEELTVAISKLNAGETLTDDDVRTISAVVESLREAPETVDEAVEDDTVADVPATDLSTLRARLSLLERRLNLI